MTMDSYRSVLATVTAPLVNLMHAYRITANALSVASLCCAAISGIAYFFAYDSTLALASALAFLLLNGLLDGLDGALARKMGTATKYGDFLDHVIDRYADVFIISGIFMGGYLRADLGALVITGVLLASYLGTQAQAVGVGRIYGGIMGRADRMVVLGLATCVTLVYPTSIGFGEYQFPLLGWALLLIGILSHVTALQRIWHARKSLLEGDKK